MVRNGRPALAVLTAVLVILTLTAQADVALGASPTVTVTKPSNGAWTGNSISVSAVAGDDAGVQKIQLWGNGGVFHTALCNAQTSCSTTFRWLTGSLPRGAYEINAVAFDFEGNTTVSPTVTIYKDAKTPVYPSGAMAPTTLPPLSVAFEYPQDGDTVSGAFFLQVQATGNSGGPECEATPTAACEAVTFTYTLDGQPAGQYVVEEGECGPPQTCHHSIGFSSEEYPDGPHTLGVTVQDHAGRSASASVTFTIANDGSTGPPLTAGFESPADGATVCGSSVPVIMSAGGGSDPDGDGIVTRSWVLVIDGSQVFTTTTQTPSSQQEATFSWNTTTYANGAHTLEVTVTDEAGQSDTATMTVNTRNADSIGLAITSPANGSTVSGTVPVTLQATEGSCNPRDFTLSVDGTQVFAQSVIGDTVTFQWDTTTVGDGPHTLTATVSDIAGHTATATTTVTVSNDGGGNGDTTKPDVKLARPTNGAWTGNSIYVNGRATDAGGFDGSGEIQLWGNGVAFETKMCAGGTVCTTAVWWLTGGLPPGAYELNAVAIDAAGNCAISPTVTIFKDARTPVHPSGATCPGGGGGTTPGLVAWFSSPANGATVSGAVEVSMGADNAQGSPTSFVLKLDSSTTLSSQSVSGSTATFIWNSATAPDGAHTLNLSVTDGAGHTATSAINVTVANGGGGGGDTIAPTVVITSPQNGWWTGNSIRVTANAQDDVGLATLKLYGDGVQFAQKNCAGATTCTWDDWWVTSGLSSGQHTITAVATDLAGNTKTSAPVTINK